MGSTLFSSGSPEADDAVFRPAIYDPAALSQRAELQRIAAAGARVCDAFADQVEELVVGRDPSREWTPEARRAATQAHLEAAGRAPELQGRWVHYPWSNRLVHLLAPEEFFFVRTDRNRNKITAAEQAALREKSIGIVGLSVGQSSAVTLAMEGVGGRYRLADFDVLSLSNMNRLRSRVQDLNLKKTILAAREMFEIDPYLDIQIWSDGLSPSTFDAFFLEGGRLDLLVEECDDLFLKVAIREYARSKGVAVLMETSDRGLLEVERFDLEPDRPIMHGLFADIASEGLRRLSTKEKVPYVLRVHDANVFSPRLCASLVEVKESLFTWPQLASSVTLGGALVTDVARRILLGSFSASGRFSVDLEALVQEAAALPIAAPAPIAPAVTDEAKRPRRIELPAPATGPVTAGELQFLAACAALAPSAGNTQPWLFRAREGVLEASVNPAQRHSIDHYGQDATLIAFGAASENVALGARALGLRAELARPLLDGGTDVVFTASFTRQGKPDPGVLAPLLERVTNRRRGDPRPLEPAHRERLAGAAASAGAELRIVTERAALDAFGALLGRGDRTCFLSEPLHRELVSEIRWTPKEVLESKDGIDLATMELTPTDAAALRVLADWPTLSLVRSWGGGRALEKSARDALAGSSALAVVRCEGDDARTFFQGGVAVERVWHAATELGIAAQPWSALLFLFRQVAAGLGPRLEPETVTELRAIEHLYRALLPAGDGTSDVFLMRLAYAPPPTARSLRR